MNLKFFLLSLAVAASSVSGAEKLDVLLTNGRIIDGTGNPWFYGDVGIRGGKIVYVGRAGATPKATETIDVTGLTITDGQTLGCLVEFEYDADMTIGKSTTRTDRTRKKQQRKNKNAHC